MEGPARVRRWMRRGFVRREPLHAPRGSGRDGVNAGIVDCASVVWCSMSRCSEIAVAGDEMGRCFAYKMRDEMVVTWNHKQSRESRTTRDR